jgi:hypothetical protein
MTDKQEDIASFFDKQQSKKQKQQKLQQQQQKKTEEHQKRAEEEKQAAKKTTDFESDDEEDSRAQIAIGAGAKVKDIKEVKKEKELAKESRRDQDFTWGHMAGSQPAANPEKPASDGKGGFARDTKKPAAASNTFQKDGINFQKTGPPRFKKSEQVASKGEFPELGVEAKKPAETKASVGGPIGQMTAPAKGARTQNQFS